MSLLAIILIIISAFMHAGWNLLSKSQRPSASFFLIASFTGFLLLAPMLALYWDTVTHGIPMRVWILLLLTGFFMAIYYLSLAGAYRAGDMSIAYPIARSSPIIVVSIVTFMLGRGEQVSTLCIAGVVLVVGGCFLIPLQRFSDLRLSNYLNATCGLALLAAIGTSGYSIFDDESLRLLRTSTQITIGNTRITLLYACLESVITSLWLAIFIAVHQKDRVTLYKMLRTNTRYAVLAGVAIQSTYIMVLLALAFANNVSYVVGFRQLSIPLGAILSIIVLKEAPHTPKLIGVAVMFIGLILVAIG